MLIQELKKTIKKAFFNAFDEEIKNDEIKLSTPPNVEMGDYTLECFQLAKKLKRKPVNIAEQLAKKIKTGNIITNVQPAGPYINFKISRKTIFNELCSTKIDFNCTDKPQKIMVEYLSPNTNKPLHLGHLRNGSIGMATANILEAIGNKVIKANLINNRGVHICKSMLAWKLFSNGETPESSGIKGDHFVGKYYVRFAEEAEKNPALKDQAQEMLKKWEQGDEEIIKLWKIMNDWVYEGFNKTYKELNFKFDVFYYESDTYKLGKNIISEGLRDKIFYQDNNGTFVFDLPNSFGLNKDESKRKVTVLRNDGTSVYITQDLGTATEKVLKHKLNQSIYVVGSEQEHHFKCLFKILEALNYPWSKKCHHLSYGMVYLPDGKMKSREGKVVDADNLVDKVEQLALEGIYERYSKEELSKSETKKRAHKIAIGAIKFYLLRVHPTQTIHFNPKESISFEGFTGPYCQYAYARAMKILQGTNIKTTNVISNIDFSVLGSSEELSLAQKIRELPEKVSFSAKTLNPSIVAIHTFEMAKSFNQFYHSNPVLKAETGVKNARIILIQTFAQAISKSLELLGIETMEEM